MSKEKDENQDHEHGNHVLHLTINGDGYDWHHQYISGAEIRNLGSIPEGDEIYLSIKKPWEDELILDETKVDLARPEIEHFFSKGKPKKVDLIVNGRVKLWEEPMISFEQVVVLAFGSYDNNPNKVYTVTYDRGPHENPSGSMVKNDSVVVKNKMVFNVTATDKS